MAAAQIWCAAPRRACAVMDWWRNKVVVPERRACAAVSTRVRPFHAGGPDPAWWYDDGGPQQPLLRKRRVNTTSQVAIVGANVCPIESLDYEIVENDLFKQDWRSRKKKQIFQYIVLKWSLPLLIGLCTGLVGFFNNLAVENIAGFKLLLTSDIMLKQRYFTAFLVYGGCNLVLAATAAAICAYIAPAAAGSGIPEVKAYLNGVDAYSMLGILILIFLLGNSIRFHILQGNSIRFHIL